jgi:hypothetical protein
LIIYIVFIVYSWLYFGGIFWYKFNWFSIHSYMLILT